MGVADEDWHHPSLSARELLMRTGIIPVSETEDLYSAKSSHHVSFVFGLIAGTYFQAWAEVHTLELEYRFSCNYT